MDDTTIQRCDKAISQLWQVFYTIPTTNRDDSNIVLDAIIKIQELPCFDDRRNEEEISVG